MRGYRLELLVFLITLLNMILIFELVRRRRLKEKYAILWLVVGFAGLLLAPLRNVLDRVANAVGVEYGPALWFLFATVFLLLVCVHLSVEVSHQEEKIRILAEELALLKEGVESRSTEARTAGRGR